MYFALSPRRALLQWRLNKFNQGMTREQPSRSSAKWPSKWRFPFHLIISLLFTIVHHSRSEHLHRSLKQNWHSLKLRAHTLLPTEKLMVGRWSFPVGIASFHVQTVRLMRNLWVTSSCSLCQSKNARQGYERWKPAMIGEGIESCSNDGSTNIKSDNNKW